VKYLTNYQIKLLDEKSHHGYSPFLLACKIGRMNIIQFIVDEYRSIVDLNSCDRDGSTALHHACWEGHLDVITFLLIHQEVNYQQHNHDNLIPLDTCRDLETRVHLITCLEQTRTPTSTTTIATTAQQSVSLFTSSRKTLQPVTQFPMGVEKQRYLSFLIEFKDSLTRFHHPVRRGVSGPSWIVSSQLPIPSVEKVESVFESPPDVTCDPTDLQTHLKEISPNPVVEEELNGEPNSTIQDDLVDSIALDLIPVVEEEEEELQLVSHSIPLCPEPIDEGVHAESNSTRQDEVIPPLSDEPIEGVNNSQDELVLPPSPIIPLALVDEASPPDSTAGYVPTRSDTPPTALDSNLDDSSSAAPASHLISSVTPEHTFDQTVESYLHSIQSTNTLLSFSVSYDDGDQISTTDGPKSTRQHPFLSLETQSFSFDFLKDSSIDSPDRGSLSSALMTPPAPSSSRLLLSPSPSQSHPPPSHSPVITSSLFFFVPFQFHSLQPLLAFDSLQNLKLSSSTSCSFVAVLSLETTSSSSSLPSFFDGHEKQLLSVAVQEQIWNISTHSGDVNSLKTLLAHFPHCLDPHLRNTIGLTPLQVALSNHHQDLALFFVQTGAYVTINDRTGNTPFHLVAFSHDMNFLLTLIEADTQHKIDINAQNEEGQTLLHLCSIEGHLSVVQYLVEVSGVDVNVLDEEGLSARNLAEYNDHFSVAKYLEVREVPVDDDEVHHPPEQIVCQVSFETDSDEESDEDEVQEEINEKSSNGEEVWQGSEEQLKKQLEVDEEDAQRLAQMDEQVGLESGEAKAVIRSSEESSVSDEEQGSEIHANERVRGEQLDGGGSQGEAGVKAGEPSTDKVEIEEVQGVKVPVLTPLHEEIRSEADTTKKASTSQNRSLRTIPKSKSMGSSTPPTLPPHTPVIQINKFDHLEDDLDDFIPSFYLKHPEYYDTTRSLSLTDPTSSSPSHIRVSTGFTPPPSNLSSEKDIATWKFLGRAIIQAQTMEDETKEAIVLSYQQLNMNPQVALSFEMRGLTMLGILAQSYSKALYHRLAQAFYIWKFLGITIPSYAHPVLFAKHGYSLSHTADQLISTSSFSSSLSNTHTPLVTPTPTQLTTLKKMDLTNPALLFALKIMARYVSRCKQESERQTLFHVWKILMNLPSRRKPKQEGSSSSTTTPGQGSKKAISLRSLSLPSSGLSTPQNQNQMKSITAIKQRPPKPDSSSLVTPTQPTKKIPKSEGRRPEMSPATTVATIEEEDLTMLGAIPSEITHLLKLNEVGGSWSSPFLHL
jgi:ankyrin repeat protein